MLHSVSQSKARTPSRSKEEKQSECWEEYKAQLLKPGCREGGEGIHTLSLV